MKPSFITAATTRNLGLSLGGIGLSLGLGLLGLSTYSSSQASSTSEDSSPQTIITNPKTVSAPIVSDQSVNSQSVNEQNEGRSPFSTTLPSQSSNSFIADEMSIPGTKQVSPASPEISETMPSILNASTTRNERIEQALGEAIPGLATCPYAQAAPATIADSETLQTHRYHYHSVDLNGDRQNEQIVQVMGPMTCGTGGCTTLILEDASNHTPSGYDVVTQMTVVNFPVVVSDRTASGWNDLLVMVSGGGAQPGYRELKFDGQSYPTNPSIEPMVASEKDQPNGTILSVDEGTEAIAPVITASDCDT